MLSVSFFVLDQLQETLFYDIEVCICGIALVAFVIALNLTVSVGTINGLIFYPNTVKIYEPIFFPIFSQLFSWLNLDLGIKTCFYHNMNSCSKTCLQFIFPAYVWFTLILIMIFQQNGSTCGKTSNSSISNYDTSHLYQKLILNCLSDPLFYQYSV